jgi:branched-subunit amino acid aminotransferase/4-amino-4-deoxychorismate lyase
MTREQIIRLAEEAGITVIGEAVWRLCELVAAAERAKVTLAAFEVAERNVAAEREACAQVCSDIANQPSNVILGVAITCAAAIRARGEE